MAIDFLKRILFGIYIPVMMVPQSLAGIPEASRVSGSLLASQVGDALSMPRQFYFDLNHFQQDTPDGIKHYLEPLSESSSYWNPVHKLRKKNGVKAGMVTQNTQLVRLLMKSVADKKRFDEGHFLKSLDGFTSSLGEGAYQGRFTSKLIQDVVQYRKRNHWPRENEPGISTSDTTEGAQLMVVLAALYRNPTDLIIAGQSLLSKLYQSKLLISTQLAYGLVVQGLINGIELDQIKYYLKSLWKLAIVKNAIPNLDTLLYIQIGEFALQNNASALDPVSVTALYGRGTSMNQVLPAAYYFTFSAKNKKLIDVLKTIAGSLGDNADCAFLSGALLGSIYGVGAIVPMLKELEEGELFHNIASDIADLRHGKKADIIINESEFYIPEF